MSQIGLKNSSRGLYCNSIHSFIFVMLDDLTITSIIHGDFLASFLES